MATDIGHRSKRVFMAGRIEGAKRIGDKEHLEVPHVGVDGRDRTPMVGVVAGQDDLRAVQSAKKCLKIG